MIIEEVSALEFIPASGIKTLANQGVESEQLVFPENSESERITVTRVTVQPDAVQPRHTHPTSEQIWIALEGNSLLLLADDAAKAFAAGDVARFADNDVHGLQNNSGDVFRYMSVTSPPVNFRNAYQGEK